VKNRWEKNNTKSGTARGTRQKSISEPGNRADDSKGGATEKKFLAQKKG